MENTGQNGLPVFIKILLFGCGILILIVGINNFVPSLAQSQLSSEYPPPNQMSVDPNPNTFGIPYPAPQLQAPSTPIPMFAWPSLEPINPKSNLPISPSQIADYATYVYEQRLQLTPRPPLITTPPSVPVSSLADLPQAIYNLPMVVDNSCIQAKNPGPILPLKSLTAEIPDYYIISFSQNNKPCAKIMVTINNNRASVNLVSNVIGDVYPGISAEEAVKDVVQNTGLQVKDQPILVYGEFLEEGFTLTNPGWQVKTTDGQVYYVIFVTSFWEDKPQVETKITILNERELHPIR